MAEEKREIILGSGDIYVTDFEGDIPEDEVIETEENRLAYIKGGASLEYAATSLTEKDDMGYLSKTIITEEEVTLNCGLYGWTGKTLEKVCATARVTEDAEQGIRTTKIGGLGNDNGKSYLIRFVHSSKDIRLTMVGKNSEGFTFTFSMDSGSSLEPSFKAEPSDNEGTLVIYKEKIPAQAGG